MRGTCLRRKFGSVIVNADEIISTGYVGAPRGRKNCIDIGNCKRQRLQIPAGERYEQCLSGDTLIYMLSGEHRTIKELSEGEDEEIHIISIEDGNIVPAVAQKPFCSGRKSIIRIVFDDNTYLDCTSNHRIMQRDGSYIEAINLKEGNSIMPYYSGDGVICNTWSERYSKPNKQERLNWKQWCKTTSTDIAWLVYQYYNGQIISNLPHNHPDELCIHHEDENHNNNQPNNLELTTRSMHSSKHGDLGEYVKNNPEQHRLNCIKGSEAYKLRRETDEKFRAEDSARRAANTRKQWENPQHRLNMLPHQKAACKKLADMYNSCPKSINSRMKGKILKGISQLYYILGTTDIDISEYDSLARQYTTKKCIIYKTATVLKRFNSLYEAFDLAKTYNHKVRNVVFLKDEVDVYDMTVPGLENFAVNLGNNSGIFVHNCRSCHSECNAIISASRHEMIDSTLYLVGIDAETNVTILGAMPCAMCKRMIINAGIKKVIIRDATYDDGYIEIDVRDWIYNDESLESHEGY